MTSKIECRDKKLQVLELEPKDEWSYHFWFGIKCGYPLCCIIWYCDSIANNGKQEGGLFEKVYRSEFMDNPNWKPTRESILNQADHNQCPECLARSVFQ